MKNIILASSSSSRQRLLKKLQLDFTTAVPDVDETAQHHETAPDLVQRLAILKARTIAHTKAEGLIIGADSVVEVGGYVFSKPLTHAQAVFQLQQASGKTMCFYTGLCLWDSATQQQQSCVETYTIKMRLLTDSIIEAYLRKEQPYQAAGSLKAEGLAIALFEYMRGDDFNVVLGLPLIRLVGMLQIANVTVLN